MDVQNNRIFPADWRVLFGQNIEHERSRLGLSLVQLAKKMNLATGSAVFEWERPDGGLPRMLVLVELCKLFNRTPDELMTKDLRKLPPNGGKNDSPHSITGAGTGETDVGGAAQPTAQPPPLSTAEPPPKRYEELEEKLLELMLEVKQIRKSEFA